MRIRGRYVCTAVSGLALGLAGLSATAARADVPTTEPTKQQLVDRINQMQSQMDQMKTQLDAQQITTADEQAAIAKLLADADKRSQLMDSVGGVTAGYNTDTRRFFIGSDDGDFLFRPWVHIQVRYSAAWREAEQKDDGDDTEHGFELRRARFGFDGNMFGKDITYFINWATYRGNGNLNVYNSSGTKIGTTSSPVGGTPVLEEAWVKYRFADTPYYIRVGQMHDPLDHENIVGSKYRAPEASLQGDIMGNTDTFTQAATFIYDNKGPVRFEGGVTDGIRAANTNFEDNGNGNVGAVYNGGVAARAEWKLMGNWKDYDQLTALNDKEQLLVVGTGIDYSYGSNWATLSHTADVQYGDPSGLFGYASYFGRYTQNNPGIPTGAPVSTAFGGSPSDLGKDTYEPTILAQVACLIGNKIEPYARYEYLYLAGTPAGSNNNVTEISLGVNYYMFQHNLKLTGQVMYLPVGIPVNDDSSDVLISNNKPEVVFITQLQLLL